MLNQVVAEAAGTAVVDAAAVSLVHVFPVQGGLQVRVAAPAEETAATVVCAGDEVVQGQGPFHHQEGASCPQEPWPPSAASLL